MNHSSVFLLALALVSYQCTVSGCGSCLFVSHFSQRRQPATTPMPIFHSSIDINRFRRSTAPFVPVTSIINTISRAGITTTTPAITLAAARGSPTTLNIFTNDNDEYNGDLLDNETAIHSSDNMRNVTAETPPASSTEDSSANPLSSSMVFAIGLYKNWISPLLPPACRFLPTCSQYGVQAIQEFGPTKGGILTAW
eukprot:CAMPEP_0172486504 /NCGR_PEP_ID=MMETSP1066-20121228/15108_1 /TAXON_ID=671091 /ORGANISM="Coscinodiscus wailesii, Strain CCMP2513" /LENGTH=195 /DNA_ID=CAMNT_0013252503 /DNA_START=23 /DNA_END=607 /DNA_ORIENTATION=+